MFGATRSQTKDRLNLFEERTFIPSTKDNNFIVAPSRNRSEVAPVFDNAVPVSYILPIFTWKQVRTSAVVLRRRI